MSRRGAICAAMFSVMLGVLPVHAALPDSQTQTWHTIVPSCSINQSWVQTPSARTASSIQVEARITCADPAVRYWASLELTDLNQQNSGIAAAHTPGDDVAGSSALSAHFDQPTRHLYLSDLTVFFTAGLQATGLGPPQCTPGYKSLSCEFDQVIVGLVARPASSAPPAPTPFFFSAATQIDGQACWLNAHAARDPVLGLRFGGSQNCRGAGALTLYFDRQETIKVAGVGYNYENCSTQPPYVCEPLPSPYGASKTYRFAIPGHVYTLKFELVMFGEAAPPPRGCVDYPDHTACVFHFNVRYEG